MAWNCSKECPADYKLCPRQTNAADRKLPNDPDYIGEDELKFIQTFGGDMRRNIKQLRHLKATSTGTARTLYWLLQGDLDDDDVCGGGGGGGFLGGSYRADLNRGIGLSTAAESTRNAGLSHGDGIFQEVGLSRGAGLVRGAGLSKGAGLAGGAGYSSGTGSARAAGLTRGAGLSRRARSSRADGFSRQAGTSRSAAIYGDIDYFGGAELSRRSALSKRTKAPKSAGLFKGAGSTRNSGLFKSAGLYSRPGVSRFAKGPGLVEDAGWNMGTSSRARQDKPHSLIPLAFCFNKKGEPITCGSKPEEEAAYRYAKYRAGKWLRSSAQAGATATRYKKNKDGGDGMLEQDNKDIGFDIVKGNYDIRRGMTGKAELQSQVPTGFDLLKGKYDVRRGLTGNAEALPDSQADTGFAALDYGRRVLANLMEAERKREKEHIKAITEHYADVNKMQTKKEIALHGKRAKSLKQLSWYDEQGGLRLSADLDAESIPDLDYANYKNEKLLRPGGRLEPTEVFPETAGDGQTTEVDKLLEMLKQKYGDEAGALLARDISSFMARGGSSFNYHSGELIHLAKAERERKAARLTAVSSMYTTKKRAKANKEIEEDVYRFYQKVQDAIRGTLRNVKRLNFSTLLQLLKLEGGSRFEPILFYEPFDPDKPWTWMSVFPKHIPEEYLVHLSPKSSLIYRDWANKQALTNNEEPSKEESISSKGHIKKRRHTKPKRSK